MKLLISLLFILCYLTHGSIENQIKLDTEGIIKNAFLTWAEETNRDSKDFCSGKECRETMKTHESKYNCSLMLKEALPSQEIIFEDINNDGIKDGIITADYEPCTQGTWFINYAMVGHLVFFISISENSFKVIEEPKVIRDEIELGRIQSVKNGIISANGASQSSQSGAHEFDIKWTAKFQYKNNKFEKISSTEKEYPKSRF